MVYVCFKILNFGDVVNQQVDLFVCGMMVWGMFSKQFMDMLCELYGMIGDMDKVKVIVLMIVFLNLVNFILFGGKVGFIDNNVIKLIMCFIDMWGLINIFEEIKYGFDFVQELVS